MATTSRQRAEAGRRRGNVVNGKLAAISEKGIMGKYMGIMVLW